MTLIRKHKFYQNLWNTRIHKNIFQYSNLLMFSFELARFESSIVYFRLRIIYRFTDGINYSSLSLVFVAFLWGYTFSPCSFKTTNIVLELLLMCLKKLFYQMYVSHVTKKISIKKFRSMYKC